MPKAISPSTNPLAYLARDEHGWELERVVAYDGLAPTQIVRSYRMADGLGPDEGAALPDRLDHAPDADRRERFAATEALGRYVVNPFALRHQLPGLWTAGPVVWDKDPDAQRYRLRQTLTRTFCAGHGYTLDEHGSYVFSESPDSMEFATVEAALKAHRPVVRRFFNSRLTFRPDLPGSYRTEIRWRDFTHESWPLLESDEGKAAASAAASSFFGDGVGELNEVHCEIDPETNTVSLIASAIFKSSDEPQDAEQLMRLPFVQSPCRRETLRAEGFGFASGGEGVRLTHSFKWSDLKDTERVRAAIDPPDEAALLPLLFAADFEREKPTLKGGRYVQSDGEPWWRFGDVVVEAQDDGLLSLVLPVVRTVWHSGGGETLVQSRENAGGWDETRREVVPSVPAGEAAAVAQAQSQAPSGQVVASVTRTERGDGSEDVARVLRPVLSALPAGAPKLGGVSGLDVSQSETARAQSWTATTERLSAAGVSALLSAAKSAVTKIRGGRIETTAEALQGDGTRRLSLTVRGVPKLELEQYVAAQDFFHTNKLKLNYGLAKDELTSGALDQNTHSLTTVERTVQEDGFHYDERITESAPSDERHLFFATLEKRAHEQRIVVHDVFRNARSVPEALADSEPTADGSCRQNEFGLYDGETLTAEAWGDEIDRAAWGKSGDAFSTREMQRSVDKTSKKSVTVYQKGGPLVEVRQTELPDGSFLHEETTETAQKGEALTLSFSTVSGDGHHRRVVVHESARNAEALPDALAAEKGQTGTARVEGGAQLNRFGLLDWQTSSWDAAAEDDTGRAAETTALGSTSSQTDVRASSQLSAALSQAPGTIVSVQETTYPDGAIRSTKTVRKATPQSWTWTTKEGSGHYVREVTHKGYRNQNDIQEPTGDITGGSWQENEFGRFDGQTSSANNDNIDETTVETTANQFSTSVTRRGPEETYAEAQHTKGGATKRNSLVTYPDDKTVASTTTVTPTAQQSWEVKFTTGSWKKIKGTGSRWVGGSGTHHYFRNATAADGGVNVNDSDGKTVSTSSQMNEFGLFDGVVTEQTSENPFDESDDQGEDINVFSPIHGSATSSEHEEEQTRTVYKSDGSRVTQSRTITTKTHLGFQNDIGAAVAALNGYDPSSSYSYVQYRENGKRYRGYLVRAVTVQVGNWQDVG